MKELLKSLAEALENWKRYRKGVKKKEFMENVDKRNMILHNMLIAIQASIDLANEIVAKRKLGEPSSYREIFKILREKTKLNKKLGVELEKLASFRNVLVHLYWKIDYNLCWKVFSKKLNVFEKFFEWVKHER